MVGSAHPTGLNNDSSSPTAPLSPVGWAPPTVFLRGRGPVPNYRRAYVPGGTVFLTVVTYRRRPTLAGPAAVSRLRRALRQVMRETPFSVPAAVVLPDHAHFLWALPRGNADYSRRVG